MQENVAALFGFVKCVAYYPLRRVVSRAILTAVKARKRQDREVARSVSREIENPRVRKIVSALVELPGSGKGYVKISATNQFTTDPPNLAG